ncbi:Maltose O-acetyltransferase [Klebsormidium nitens]|uniref:Maltose O-acetyltransferase n=1 Tax=Klebsormidium nitens TaxID=105231 RepID=A0A1Y1HZB6_KLENI|nr:Maltose O-acetyltransferase [Klebsormidium nitens]|eukprot:GAQ83082.1 Maltose O-acetyltransferase [Klebsormidium nitens]
MLAGELYSPLQNPELKTLHRRAVKVVNEFNETPLDEEERRAELMKDIFGSIGTTPYIEPRFFCDYGKNTFIGNNFYANAGLVILDANTVHIGNDVLCAPNVQIYAATHPTDPATRAAGLELALPIRIGNNVWIGGSAIINPGVTVGDNSVIGSGSVVTRDVPPNVVVAGNPARVLKQLVGTA